MRNVTILPSLRLLVLLLLTGLLSGSAFGQFTRSIVADEVANNGPVYYGNSRNVARTTTGTLVAIWQDGTGQIVTATYDEAFQDWLLPVQVSFAGDEASKAGIIADNGGGLHAAWQQREPAGNWQIWYANYLSGTWSAPVRVDSDSLDAEECSIEVDSNGRIWVVWNTDNEPDGAEWILASHSDDTGVSWSSPDTLSSPDGIINGSSTTSARVGIWAGSNGRLATIWHEDFPGREREIYVNQYDGSAWQGEVVVSDTTDTTITRHWYTNVCMDASDNIYVLFANDRQGSDPRQLLMTSKAWDASWQPAWTTLYTDTNGDFLTNALTIDPNGNLYAGFRRPKGDGSGTEEVAYVTSQDGGSTWSEPVALSRDGYDAGYLTFVGHVTGSVVDAIWRESYLPGVDDDDTTAIVYAAIDFTTGIEEPSVVAGEFALSQNYPNPFNPSTNVRFSVLSAGDYELAIYNILGEKVRTLTHRHYATGEYTSAWDGRNDAGSQVTSGVYFYRLSSAKQTLTRKMILMK
ncbi:MAG TPA: T9SS type A sorting domain-containing protein [Calditrichia bacterium]|nr:T9SS type A sorting domain-containing protein [Calditrichota bacterium]HQU71388.1 T9SS type A sorting domain-containing protein [Calditrichia bacterium]HQV31361.1 T9SS type A sorting domain-containing protein [Calditrichia bacterium]